MARRLAKIQGKTTKKANVSASKPSAEPAKRLSEEEQGKLNLLFIFACRADDFEKVKRLYKQGADANSSHNGFTALMDAAAHGQIKTCEFLIEKGATVNAIDRQWSTALMWAAMLGQTEVCKLLLEKKADIHAKDMHGTTALMYAVRQNKSETANFLMEYLIRDLMPGKNKEFVQKFMECAKA